MNCTRAMGIADYRRDRGDEAASVSAANQFSGKDAQPILSSCFFARESREASNGCATKAILSQTGSSGILSKVTRNDVPNDSLQWVCLALVSRR